MGIDEVGIVDGIKSGPANLAAKLAQGATDKKNPIVDVVIVTRLSDGSIHCGWTDGMSPAELSEMVLCLDTEAREKMWEVWHPEDYYESEEDA